MLRWQDDFEGAEINTTNWVVASLRDPVSGDHLGTGDHLLGYQYAGYITEEDTYVEDGSLVLRNQKRSYQGTSPQGEFDYTTGHVMSMHRVSFNKGYVEIRAQFPTGDKVSRRASYSLIKNAFPFPRGPHLNYLSFNLTTYISSTSH